MALDDLPAPPMDPRRRRRALLWTLGVFFLLVALGVGLFLYQDIGSKWRLARLVERLKQSGEPALLPDIDDAYRVRGGEDNAADIFLEAAYLTEVDLSNYDKEVGGIPVVGTGELPPLGEKLPPSVLSLVEAYCKEREGIFPLLRKAAERKGCAYNVNLRVGLNVSISHVARLRQLARCLALHGILAAEKGDPARAAECVRLGLAAAGSLKHEPVLVSGIVRNSMIEQALMDLERLLSTHAVPADAATRLDEALAAQMDLAPLRRVLVGERALGIFIGQQVARGKMDLASLTQGAPGPTPAVAKAGSKAMLFLFRGALRDSTVRGAEYMTAGIGCTELPPYEGWKQARELTMALRKELNPRGGAVQRMKSLLPTLLLHSVEATYESHLRTYARVAAARVALAVEAYRREYGRLPETLDDLTPRFLDAVPDDPFAKAKLRYRKAEKGYVVYGVGADETDQGGLSPTQSEGLWYSRPDIAFRVTR
jgi:hypothetical protein